MAVNRTGLGAGLFDTPQRGLLHREVSFDVETSGGGLLMDNKDPHLSLAAVHGLLTQSARAALVLFVRLDRGVEGSRVVNCHGMLLSGR